MRFPRSRRRNLVLVSTRPASPVARWSGMQPGRHSRRRLFRFARTGFVLALIGAVRLARAARSHWRISLGLGGLLSEIVGHAVFTGQVRSAVDLLGLFLVLTAVLKSTGPAGDRRPVVPQTAWRWHA